MRLPLKVNKNENFFGFDFEFCTVSLLVMLKYEGFVKTILYWTIMGGGRIIPHSLKTMGNKNCFKPRPIFFLNHNDPFIFPKIVFSKIRSINSSRDGFMCKSWAKMLKFIPLSLRLSGIEFSLV